MSKPLALYFHSSVSHFIAFAVSFRLQVNEFCVSVLLEEC